MTLASHLTAEQRERALRLAALDRLYDKAERNGNARLMALIGARQAALLTCTDGSCASCVAGATYHH